MNEKFPRDFHIHFVKAEIYIRRKQSKGKEEKFSLSSKRGNAMYLALKI